MLTDKAVPARECRPRNRRLLCCNYGTGNHAQNKYIQAGRVFASRSVSDSLSSSRTPALLILFDGRKLLFWCWIWPSFNAGALSEILERLFQDSSLISFQQDLKTATGMSLLSSPQILLLSAFFCLIRGLFADIFREKYFPYSYPNSVDCRRAADITAIK